MIESLFMLYIINDSPLLRIVDRVFSPNTVQTSLENADSQLSAQKNYVPPLLCRFGTLTSYFFLIPIELHVVASLALGAFSPTRSKPELETWPRRAEEPKCVLLCLPKISYTDTSILQTCPH